MENHIQSLIARCVIKIFSNKEICININLKSHAEFNCKVCDKIANKKRKNMK